MRASRSARWAPVAAVAAALAAGCLGPDRHVCAGAADCAGGTCEANGYCSFPGGPGGCQAYGAGAGSLAGTCVGDAGVVDAGVDTPVLDGAVDAAAPGDGDGNDGRDGDGDGVEDPVDNCPAIANPDQHNEDADAWGDACDNCPHVATDAAIGQANVDDDDLGDACDPSAARENRIVAFEPFAVDGAAPPGWAVIDGTWPVSDDEAHTSGPVTTANRIELPLASPVSVVVTAGARLDAIVAGATRTYAAVFTPVAFAPPTPATPSGHGCGALQLPGADRQAAHFEVNATGGIQQPTAGTDTGHTLTPGSEMVLTYTTGTGTTRCETRLVDGTRAINQMLAVGAPSQLGLAVRGGTVAWRYVLVYTE